MVSRSSQARRWPTYRVISHVAGIVAVVLFLVALGIQIAGVPTSPAVHMTGNPVATWPMLFVLGLLGLVFNSNTYIILFIVVVLIAVMWFASKVRESRQ